MISNLGSGLGVKVGVEVGIGVKVFVGVDVGETVAVFVGRVGKTVAVCLAGDWVMDDGDSEVD